MNLNNFEDHVDTVILERGFYYYQDDSVLSLEKTGKYKYDALVEGTELYRVSVELEDQGNIAQTICDCPYVHGEFCKHQVAVFYALRNDQNEDKLVETKISRTKEPDSLKKMLMDQDKDKLVGILLAISEENEVLKKQILLEIGQGNDDDLVSNAVVLIRSCIDRYSDRHGFVHYDSTWDAIRGATQTLDKAWQVSEKGRQVLAVRLTLTVMREMLELINQADDSGGCIGQIIDEAFNLLDDITSKEALGDNEKEEILEMLINEVDYKAYDEWSDWQLDLLRCCASLVDKETLRNIMEQKLNALVTDKMNYAWFGNYYVERVKLIQYSLIRQCDGEKQARDFMLNNLHHSGFREMAIKEALEEQDYEGVIELALEGEQQDSSLPGLLQKWREYRYQAYQLANKIKELRELALEFILDGHFPYYKCLKESYNRQEWPAVYQKIIGLLEEQGNNRQSIYTSILVVEDEKEKLFEYVQANPDQIATFYKELLPLYEDEVFRLFVRHIENMAANTGDRRGYKQVCQVIRRLKKIGGRKQAAAVKEKLLQQYKRRPAFCDELSRT